MTQQLVTIHGCKHTDASVVSYQHMQSAGRRSTAFRLGEFKVEALHGGREEEDTDVCGTSVPDNCAVLAPQPHFKALLSDGVCIPQHSTTQHHSPNCA